MGGRPARRSTRCGAGRARTSRSADDRLLAWKWKDRVLDRNAATDADQDAALALVLASRRFGEARYLEEARGLLARRLGAGGDPGRRPPLPDRRQLGAARAVPDHPRRLPRARTPTRCSPRWTRRDPWKELVRVELRRPPLPLRRRGARAPARARLRGPADAARSCSSVPGGGGARAVRLRRRADLLARRARRALVRAARRGGPARADARASRARPGAPRGGSAIATPPPGAPLSELDGLPHLASVAGARAVEDPALAAELRAAQARRALRARARGRGDPVLPPQLALVRPRARARRGAPLRRAARRSCSLLDWGAVPGPLPAPPGRAPGSSSRRSRGGAPGRARAPARALRSALSAPLPRVARGRETLNFVEPLGPVDQPVAPRGGGLRLLDRRAPRRAGRASRGAAPRRAGPARAGRAPPVGGRPRPDLLRVARDPRPDARRLRRAALARARRSTSATTRTARRSRGSRRSTARATCPARGATPRRGTSTTRSRVTHGRPRRRLRHRPRPGRRAFLERTVPHFRDPRMGVVQTPHHFYNPDVFQRAFGARRRGAERGRPLQPRDPGRARRAGAARSSSGAARCSGARRIASVGGFNLLSITEDIHTSQKLHARGWRSAFVDEDLAAGLSAESVPGLPRPAAPLDARVPADLLPGQPAPRARAPAPPPGRLPRLALVLLLPARAASPSS